ncbi:methionine--tRNA ligase [Flexithrix dorotheae]|uniref:methionine--tRNA ligase n=1 Tax=Flexithrix dorotheae TaxID=70993 RepID=UPI0004755FF3|nr:methionine--tRNA ligase [Flexithrix dorotheae]
MEEKKYKKYTVTAALPYANGPLHIGHIAGAYLPADIYVRFLRESGRDVAFICGSDEHGAAITIKAQKEGVTPKQVIDKFHKINKETFEEFGIDFSIYHRTSAPIHHETAQDFFKVLNEKKKFTIDESEQYYDQEANQFLADRYIVGECPKCGNESAYGDQCEKCGSSLVPTDLINPKSTITGSAPILKKTKHWYLPLNDHEEWVNDWITKGELDGKYHHNPKEWKKHVLGQCKSWIDGGLQPRPMTRDLEWGVKVPLEGADGKVLYVWLDAPIGYISATKEWAKEAGKNWEDYWKNEDTKLVHFIGKDNIVFHCIIFPIILKSYGDGFLLPNNIPANEFLNLEGNKLSTSRNWAVWVHEYLNDFPGKQDELRYVLNSNAPENKDSEFTWKDYQAKVNNELVAILGNFVNRAIVLTNKYFNGDVPVRGELAEYDKEIINKIAEVPEKVEKLIENYRFKEAQFEVMNLARIGNKYLADTEPWKLIKEDPEIVKTILNIALQLTANLGVLLTPFLPKTAKKIQYMVGLRNPKWNKAGRVDLLYPYDKLGIPELLFSKIEDSQIEYQIKKLEKAKVASNVPAEPVKEPTTFDDFTQMDIRVGTILHAEKVPKTKKLLKLQVDTGVDKRTIVSGIAEFFKPEEIIGLQVCVLANLEPRKIKGINSEGMILMAEDRDGSLSFIAPRKKVTNGGVVR